jgi:hypothetical protein
MFQILTVMLEIETLQNQAMENVRDFKPEFDPVGVKESGQLQDDAKFTESDVDDDSTQAEIDALDTA